MPANLWIFFLSVWRHWEPLVLGGGVGVFIFVYEHRKKEPIPWRLIGYIMAGALLVSCFSAWQDQYTSAEWRGIEISRLNGLMQGKEEQIKNLQNALMLKDRPVILQYATDPEIAKMLERQNKELAKLKDSLPSPKKKALQLSNDMIKFMATTNKNSPSPPIPHNPMTRDQWDAAERQYEQQFEQWARSAIADYQMQFALRIATVSEDFRNAGIGDIYTCQNSPVNTLSMERCATIIGALAEKLPR
jgi:hypothetical protein